MKKKHIGSWAFFAAAVLTGISIPLTVASANYIPSSSMEPTLSPGDQVLVNKLDRSPRLGDVMVFRDVGDWMGDGQQNLVIKRVLGLPGDTVECCSSEGSFVINGQRFEQPYAVEDRGEKFTVTVPEGHLFMVGDNRPNSADSRSHLQLATGFVPLESVVGTAYAVRWPLDRIGLLD